MLMVALEHVVDVAHRARDATESPGRFSGNGNA
jgi:hypothetical protein